MQKRLILICNPRAGRGLSPERMMHILHYYSGKGYLVSVYLTRKRDTADLIRQKLGADLDTADRIVCSGGDGMVNLVLNVLLGAGQEASAAPVFGYLPQGTTNDFARSIGIPAQFDAMLDASISDHKLSMDAGSLNGRYFMYVAGFGLFTDVAYKTPQKQKNTLGYLAYLLNGVKSLSELKPLHLKVEVTGAGGEKEEIEGSFILGLVTNSQSVAGMKLTSETQTSFCDGLFEMILVRNPENLLQLSEILTAALTSNINDPNLVYRQGSAFRFTGDRQTWTLDGEFGGSYKESDICVRQGAVQIAVNGEEENHGQ